MSSDEGEWSVVEVRCLDPDVDTTEAGRPLLHAVTPHTMQARCGHSTYRLLPTLEFWWPTSGAVRPCADCCRLSQMQKRPSEPARDREASRIWTYGSGVNYLGVAVDGVTFRLLGSGFFRCRRLSWDKVDVFCAEKYNEPGLSRDKGAGTKRGNALAWRIGLHPLSGRSIPIPCTLPAKYSEKSARELAAAFNSALDLPRHL
jgi:hypothetical protein